MIYILDDEPEMVKALDRLLRAKGFEVHGFTCVREFQNYGVPEDVACLILDVAVPDELTGLSPRRAETEVEDEDFAVAEHVSVITLPANVQKGGQRQIESMCRSLHALMQESNGVGFAIEPGRELDDLLHVRIRRLHRIKFLFPLKQMCSV